jgi:hypothetical protein
LVQDGTSLITDISSLDGVVIARIKREAKTINVRLNEWMIRQRRRRLSSFSSSPLLLSTIKSTSLMSADPMPDLFIPSSLLNRVFVSLQCGAPMSSAKVIAE